MANILAFDTATTACSVAVWCDGIVHQKFEIAPRRHGELLLPMIDSLLKEAALKINDFDAIALGNGPGSFMGLRIAAGVAQGLAFGAGIPVVTVSTLQALAQTAYWVTAAQSILVGWDARMQQIYWGLYKVEGERVFSVLPDQLSVPSGVCLSNEKCFLAAGNAWEIYADNLPQSIINLTRPDQPCYPSAKAVAFLAADLYEQGVTVDPQSVELAYLRNRVASIPSH